MASRIGPRTVKDATRFTSTVPHATSMNAAPPSIANTVARKGAAAAGPKKSTPRIPGESPEQRVRRLRDAHMAAQKAKVSQLDQVITVSRRMLDAVHRWTISGIVLFTVIATIVSVYSVWDMLRYNRARRAEWLEAQKKYEEDELALARIAYLKGTATDEQVDLVEYANRRAEEQGVKLPPLLDKPETRTHFEEKVQTAFTGSGEQQGRGIFGVVSGFFGGGDKAAAAAAPAETDKAAGIVQVAEDKVKGALQAEKAAQRAGGPLDQIGLDKISSSPSTSKGWWPW